MAVTLSPNRKTDIMEKLGTWFKNRREASRKPSADRPPYRPSLRRPLTPVSPQDFTPQPSACLFFSKLPANIRRAILIAAFGKRTVHIDLAFDYPLIPAHLAPPLHPGHKPNHAGIYRQQDDDGRPPRPRGSKAWRWGSSVCHRDMEWRPKRLARYKTGPWDDHCMEGGPTLVCTHRFGGTPPGSCRVGAIGFLLSCRQAYAEGTDIVYTTNCISLVSQPLLLHLPRLLLPQRLASIRSMEVVVRACFTREERYYSIANLANLAPVLDNISTHCRSLRSLFLSVDIPEHANFDELSTGPMLPIIDAFCLSMDLRDMVLEIPEHIYDAFKSCAVIVGPFHPLEPEKPKERILYWGNPWRCLDGVDGEGRPKPKPETQMRTLGNYPGPPLQLPTPENADRRVPSRGYWFKDGLPYMPPLRVVTCF